MNDSTGKMDDSKNWKEFYEKKYLEKEKLHNKNSTNYGISALVFFLISIASIVLSNFLLKESFGSACLTIFSLASIDPTMIKASISSFLIGFIFYLTSIAYAGAGLATGRGLFGACLTIILTILPVIIFTIGFIFGVDIFSILPDTDIANNNPSESSTNQCFSGN